MKIALGMSGGVDSSVCAALLKDAGHEVTGVFLECWRAPGCRAENDRRDALAVALDLNLPFRVLDFKEAYRQRVVEIFFRDYELGLTPNPDVWCNTEIKFGLFYDWAMSQGFDAVATGHYAQILSTETLSTKIPGGDSFQKLSPREKHGQIGSHVLGRGADEKKDQSYFLYRTRAEQLPHIIFPIGHLTKDEVRAIAKQKELLVADKPDSQGICFIGDINVRDFLKERLGEQEGDVLDIDGNVIGRHQGHWLYTIGQRHGFTLSPKVHTKQKQWKHVLPPLYVISKSAEDNTITVGFGVETMVNTVELIDVFWRDIDIFPGESRVIPIKARVRHGGQLLNATITLEGGGRAEIAFAEPQRGLAAGQAVVFYDESDDRICWGGGVMAK